MLALDYTAVVVNEKVGPVKPVNHTSWVVDVHPNDLPKSVRNRCVIGLSHEMRKDTYRHTNNETLTFFKILITSTKIFATPWTKGRLTQQ